MKALLKENITRGSHNRSMTEYLKAKEGTWIEIDTDCLFTNQYNTKDGFRIYDWMIRDIKDDVRRGKGRCNYCGKISVGDKCNCCDEGKEYFVKFTEDNCYFLNKVAHLEVIEFDEIQGLGTTGGTTLQGYKDLYYIVKNSRFNVKFKYDMDTDSYYVFDGIGYAKQNILNINKHTEKAVKTIIRAIHQVNK
ncbi:MAG: hypothetical protein ACRDBY_14195 [Cetobacterium sp.]